MNATSESFLSYSKSMTNLRISTAVLSVLVYVGGFLGNFLSFLLFMQKELREVSTGLCFLLLNIFSTIHLASLIVEFIDSIFDVQFNSSVFRCQFILWIQNMTRTVCALLAATISFDRFLRSEYPMQSRIWCTTKNVSKVAIGYILFSTLLYALFFYPLNIFDDHGECSFNYNMTFRLFALNILSPLRFIVNCVIPTLMMIICGTKMLYNIRRSRQRIRMQPPRENIQNTGVNQNSDVQSSQKNDRNTRPATTLDQMLVMMVLANVVAFTITQTPFNIYMLYYGYESENNYTTYSLTRAFLLMCGSIYFGIGFYLFCLTSSQFRRQFKEKIKKIFSFIVRCC